MALTKAQIKSKETRIKAVEEDIATLNKIYNDINSMYIKERIVNTIVDLQNDLSFLRKELMEGIHGTK